eukprot:1160114-Pelagomonas_calceolata.AAC.9
MPKYVFFLIVAGNALMMLRHPPPLLPCPWAAHAWSGCPVFSACEVLPRGVSSVSSAAVPGALLAAVLPRGVSSVSSAAVPGALLAAGPVFSACEVLPRGVSSASSAAVPGALLAAGGQQCFFSDCIWSASGQSHSPGAKSGDSTGPCRSPGNSAGSWTWMEACQGGSCCKGRCRLKRKDKEEQKRLRQPKKAVYKGSLTSKLARVSPRPNYRRWGAGPRARRLAVDQETVTGAGLQLTLVKVAPAKETAAGWALAPVLGGWLWPSRPSCTRHNPELWTWMESDEGRRQWGLIQLHAISYAARYVSPAPDQPGYWAVGLL